MRWIVNSTHCQLGVVALGVVGLYPTTWSTNFTGNVMVRGRETATKERLP